MADKITIQQPVNLELFASIIKVLADHSKEHKKDVQFIPQGKEVVILVDSKPKTANAATVFPPDDED